MARALNVSSSFLSAIERGKKNVPDDMLERINAAYKLTDNEFQSLELALEQDIQTFLITPANDIEHRTVAMFARNIRTLPDSKLKKIQDILKSGE